MTTAPAFPIGFRLTGSPWTKDLDGLIRFCTANGFASVDLTAPLPRADVQRLVDAGLRIGTVDIVGGWGDLASPEAGKRAATADATVAYIASLAPLAKMVFTVAMAEDGRPRSESFGFAVEGYGRLCEGLAKHDAKVLFEGWPGGAPHYSSLGCTPADLRALFKELPANAGVNFDPSHLVRMGIDPLRFAEEFAPRIHHVHGKDTELFAEALYEHGHLQPATFAKEHGWGGHHWRYCIPGRGAVAWRPLLRRLAERGFRGLLSIELEDQEFCTGEAGEQRGLIAARRHLLESMAAPAAAARAG